MPRYAGIEFIQTYLQCLYHENAFLCFFSPEAVDALLCGYAADYARHVVNLYAVVLTVALGCTMCSVDIYQLKLAEDDQKNLCRRLTLLTAAEQYALLQKAADTLCQTLDGSQSLNQYITGSLPYIAQDVAFAAECNQLNRLFCSPAVPVAEERVSLIDHQQMEDESYRELVAEINRCRYPADKVMLMKRHIRSFKDLTDILRDAYLDEADYQLLFRRITPQELSVLVKQLQITKDADDYYYTKKEKLIWQYLQNHLSALPQEERQSISSLSDKLDID